MAAHCQRHEMLDHGAAWQGASTERRLGGGSVEDSNCMEAFEDDVCPKLVVQVDCVKIVKYCCDSRRERGVKPTPADLLVSPGVHGLADEALTGRCWLEVRCRWLSEASSDPPMRRLT